MSTMLAIAIGQPAETSKALAAMNFSCVLAADGIDGIRKVIRHQPDAVVVEIDLPHLNGVNLVKILQLLQIRLPVVFTSATEKFKGLTTRFGDFAEFLLDKQIPDQLEYSVLQLLKKTNRTDSETPLILKAGEWSNLLSVSGRKRVLLVEDDEDTLRLLLSFLEQQENYELYSARNGLEGLHKAVCVQPDLILADIVMPVLDGLSMSQILYILGKPYPIVFLSAKDDDETVNRARNMEGVVGYMLKTEIVDNARFIRDVRNHIKMGETMMASSPLSYRDGYMETLVQTGSDRGVLKDVPSVEPRRSGGKRFPKITLRKSDDW